MWSHLLLLLIILDSDFVPQDIMREVLKLWKIFVNQKYFFLKATSQKPYIGEISILKFLHENIPVWIPGMWHLSSVQGRSDAAPHPYPSGQVT